MDNRRLNINRWHRATKRTSGFAANPLVLLQSAVIVPPQLRHPPLVSKLPLQLLHLRHSVCTILCRRWCHSSSGVIAALSRARTHAHTHTHTHTRTHPFNGSFSGTTQVSRYQKGKTNLDFTLKQETVSGSGISWAICKSAPCSKQTPCQHPTTQFFTGRMSFLPPNQQCQSTDQWKPNLRQLIKMCIIFSDCGTKLPKH